MKESKAMNLQSTGVIQPVTSVPTEWQETYLSIKGALNILKGQRSNMTRAFYKKKCGNDPTLLYRSQYQHHAKAEVLFHELDVIPFSNLLTPGSIDFLIVTLI